MAVRQKINSFIHDKRHYTFRAKMKQAQGFNAAVISGKPDRLFR